MNQSDYLKREVDGFCRRGLGSVTDVDDILMEDELRRMGERRRATDEADGFFKHLEDGED